MAYKYRPPKKDALLAQFMYRCRTELGLIGWEFQKAYTEGNFIKMDFKSKHDPEIQMMLDFGPSMVDVGVHVQYIIWCFGKESLHGMVESVDQLPRVHGY